MPIVSVNDIRTRTFPDFKRFQAQNNVARPALTGLSIMHASGTLFLIIKAFYLDRLLRFKRIVGSFSHSNKKILRTPKTQRRRAACFWR